MYIIKLFIYIEKLFYNVGFGERGFYEDKIIQGDCL